MVLLVVLGLFSIEETSANKNVLQLTKEEEKLPKVTVDTEV